MPMMMTKKKKETKMTIRKGFIVPFCALAIAAGGCGRGELPLTEAEARERTSGTYAAAMDALQSGRIDDAVEGFRKVIRDEPRSHSAHFQLATLLQDAKKDYIGAIAHYREYRALRPKADKSSLAKDREALCERLLAAQYAKASAQGDGSSGLQKENEKLAADLKKAKAENIELAASLAEAQKTVRGLEHEVANLRKMVGGIGGAEDPADDARRPAPIINPSDAALLDDDGEDSKPIDRIAMSEDLKMLKLDGDGGKKGPEGLDAAPGADEDDGKRPFATTAGKADEESGKRAFDSVFGAAGKKKDKDADKEPSRPATYTVQQGDTLFRISERFYGSSSHWRKIREANKASVPTDGRVNAGQVLILP